MAQQVKVFAIHAYSNPSLIPGLYVEREIDMKVSSDCHMDGMSHICAHIALVIVK